MPVVDLRRLIAGVAAGVLSCSGGGAGTAPDSGGGNEGGERPIPTLDAAGSPVDARGPDGGNGLADGVAADRQLDGPASESPAGGLDGPRGDAGGAAGDAAPGVAYRCTQLLGPNVTGEWFAAGFETFVPDARWQVKAPHRSFVEDWADPAHSVWRDSGCDGTFFDCEVKSKCAGGVPPDRVIFVTQTGDYLGTSQRVWEERITAAIKTIKAKYPMVQQVELMTFVRGPGNTSCGTETTVSANLDRAHLALAAASNGSITAAPRFEVTRCADFAGPPHLSADGRRRVAEMIGRHYAMEP